MTSTFQPTFAIPSRQSTTNVASAAAIPVAPVGTFAPGTKVQVGGHRVIIVRYLSEGGFAHVYLVRLPKPINGDDGAVLKRVAVPDKEALANMRTEVETMKKLRGQHYIVTYIDSHASQLKGGGYEVFLLMEYCNGGGLIDFMNTRLQNRLTEPEVMKIFSDTALGVACMHYLKPPLLHRDLKVENILITSSGSSTKYKLCDFGSTAPPRPAATTAAEGRLIEEDVQKHTTLQYRSPEMIDVYRKQPIDEKSDIWALGVLLFKLCYYKTPFEDQGQMAILNASFKFPGYPAFSDTLKKLIAGMLREKPQARPNIYQVIREVSLMRGTDIPIKDIYAGRTPSEARQHQRLPPVEPPVASPPTIGVSKAPPQESSLSIPEITPMRRGRPTKMGSDTRSPKPSPSPLRIANGDPFSALDSTATQDSNQNVDDISSRFPSVDEFSLLHQAGDKFAFDGKPSTTPKASSDITQRVTNALADDAFARPAQPKESVSISRTAALGGGSSSQVKGEKKLMSNNLAPLDDRDYPKSVQEVPQRSKMISTGTMTSPTVSSESTLRPSDSRSKLRFPSSANRSSSSPRASDASFDTAAVVRADSKGKKRPGLLDHRSKSQVGTIRDLQAFPSHRPSLEPQGTPIADLNRSQSASAKIRPSSLHVEPRRRSLRSRAHSKEILQGDGSQSLLGKEQASTAVIDDLENGQEAAKISSNVDFLKAMEEEDPAKRKEKRSSSGSKHIKRSSMPSISLSGTKNLLAGRFGEAFRRFETNTNDSDFPPPALSPDQEGYNLTPIAGSEATDGRSDDGQVYEEIEAAPPEVRRELERRRLSQEEKRVAEAGAAYRQRLAEGGDGPINPRAASIQSKVKTLLDESGRGSPSPTKKPQGYGRFTDSPVPQRLPSPSPLSTHQIPRKPPPAFRVPPRHDSLPSSPTATVRPASTKPPSSQPPRQDLSTNSSSSRPSVPITPATAPPSPRPKPQALRTGNQHPKPSPLSSKPLPFQPPGLPTSQTEPEQTPSRHQSAQPLTKRSSNPYRPPAPAVDSFDGASVAAAATENAEDWESSFSKRYPTLAGLEMVETEINGRAGMVASPQMGVKIKDV
ncbi:MAG: hypothetical protein Q9220_006044 [cf. Caloplaca sp. 1 TL-2023]